MFEVDPVADKLLARGAFALRNLVVVMRKTQIDAAGMNVEGLSEVLHRHRRALNVLAGTTATNFSVPGGFCFCSWFLPECKIARVFFLVCVCVDALTRAGNVPRKINLR